MNARPLIDWFSGGSRHYMTLVHCMGYDYLWIGITVALDLFVAAGYALIALHWRRNERLLRDSPAKTALGSMKNIFVFCGICGYVFIPVKMFWPAWRLYDGFLAVLAYHTWRYALRSRELQVVYGELDRSARVAEDVKDAREAARRNTDFLNAISHDLKTPLNGLMLQAELAELSASSGDAATLREALGQIRLCARTTADLLDNFLELGRLGHEHDSVHHEDFPLAATLRRLADLSRPKAKLKGLKVEVNTGREVQVRTDRVKFERVVTNLLDNAIKFTDEGCVRLVAEASPRGVTVRVVDTGVGIDTGQQARIFDDFVQVGNDDRDGRKGFGLGLAIARRLVRQLGGDLTVESEPGRGSRFTVALPADVLAAGEGAVPAAHGGKDRAPRAGGHDRAATRLG